MGTGATVTVTNSTTKEVMATYTVVVFGDLDGNASADVYDLASLLAFNAESTLNALSDACN